MVSEWCDVREREEWERKKGFMVVVRQVRQQSRARGSRHHDLVEVVKDLKEGTT